MKPNVKTLLRIYMIHQFQISIYCLQCVFFNNLCLCGMNADTFVCFGNFIFCLIYLLVLYLKV
jgi:hypothetical protein